MATIHNETLSLLEKLKHKKFSSQIDQNSQHQESGSLFDSKSGFICSYHPTEIVTNFCISEGEEKIKPLCPRCLQQHIKSHQERSTICKLETCDTEIKRITNFLTEKLTKCSNLDEKILGLSSWKIKSVEEMKSELKKYKKEISESIESLFNTMEAELIKKYQEQNNPFEQTVKVLESSIPDFKEICTRSMNFLNQSKDLNNIILSLSQITEKYQNLINNEKRMIDNSSINPELRFNRAKFTEAINCIKNSLEYKFNKINEYEIEQKLKKVKIEKQKQSEILAEEGSLNSKLKKMLSTNSTSKLQTIDTFKKSENNRFKEEVKTEFSSIITSSPSNFSQTHPSSSTKEETPSRDLLEKLNDTTNRLKSSLNGFYKINKNKAYQ